MEDQDYRGEVTIIIGFLLSLFGNLFLTVSSVSVQGVNGHSYSEPELNFFRFVGSGILVTPILFFRRQLPRLETKTEVLGAAAVTLLTVGFNWCFFAAVKCAPMGVIGCLYRTAIMTTCLILARVIMKEEITVLKVVATIIGTGGIVLVTQPWKDDSTKQDSECPLSEGYILATASGIFAATKVIAQKRLIPETDVVTLQFWSSLGGTIISALCMAIPGQLGSLPKGKNTLTDWLLLLAHAFSTGIGTLLCYKSQQMISAILYGLTASVNVVFMLIAQYTVLRHIQEGHKNAEEYTGAILVIFSAVLVPAYGIIKKKFFSNRKIDELTPLKEPGQGKTLNDGHDDDFD